MNEPDYLLQSFGISAYTLQNGVSIQIIKDAAIKIHQLSQSGHNTCLVDISNKLLPVIEDAKFSSIWAALLDGLSSLSHHKDAQMVFSQIYKKQAKMFYTGSLPIQILHKLWLSHLPSLEFAVLKLVEHICSNHCVPVAAVIHDAFTKSCMAEIASKEIIVYETVYDMLMSMIVSSDYATIMTEIAAAFCCIVRTTASEFTFQNQMKNTSVLVGTFNQLEMLLRSSPEPETMTSSSILNTLHEMHIVWTNITKTSTRPDVTFTSEQSSSLHTISQEVPDHHFEDLWCLTVQFRSWMFAALNNIFSCDQKNVESCLWYIALCHRIELCSAKFKPLEVDLHNYVHGLRDLLSTFILYSELSSQVIPLAVKTISAMESKLLKLEDQEKTNQLTTSFCRSVINLILMAFFFQSDGGFTIGEEIAAFVTSSDDISDHIRCLTYHYHVLNISPKEWNSFKRDHFQSYVRGLCLKLENVNRVKEVADFIHIYSGLKLLLPDSCA